MSTVYMGLTLPTPTVTDGPEWATEVNQALTDVDAHDHTSGKGKKVPTAGIDINDDLDMNSHALDATKTVRLDNQVAALSGSGDIRNIYAIDGDLYYNNGSGVAVQVTDGNSVALPTVPADTIYHQFTFSLDGPYYVANGGTFPATDQGQRFIAVENITITDVYFLSKTQGSSGTTEIDLKKSTSGSGTWTSIFSTTPKATSTASGNSWISVGGSVTGYTAPILSVLQSTMTAGQALRLDIVSTMAGTPSDAYITIKYRKT